MIQAYKDALLWLKHELWTAQKWNMPERVAIITRLIDHLLEDMKDENGTEKTV